MRFFHSSKTLRACMITIFVLAVLFASLSIACAAETEYVAQISDSNGKLIKYTTLEAACAAVEAGDDIQLLRSTEVSADFLPSVNCRIYGLKNEETVITVLTDSSCTINAGGQLYLQDVIITASGPSAEITLNMNGHGLSLSDSSVPHIDMVTSSPEVCRFYNQVHVDSVVTSGKVEFNTASVYADTIRASVFDINGSCTLTDASPDSSEAILQLSNTSAQSRYFEGNGIMTIETDSSAMLSSDGAAIISLDVPASIPVSETDRILAGNSLKNILPESAGKVPTLFGIQSVPGSASPLCTSYNYLAAEAYSIECDPSVLNRTMFRAGDTLNLSSVTAVLTYRHGSHIYKTERPHGYGNSFPDGTITCSVMHNQTIPEGAASVYLTWQPASGITRTCTLFGLTDYVIVDITNSHDQYCTGSLSFNETATAALGSRFEIENPSPVNIQRIRVVKGDSIVLNTATYQSPVKITAGSCTVVRSGEKQFTVSGLAKDTAVNGHFCPLRYTISCGSGGTYTTDKLTMTFTPDEGYQVKEVILNGVSYGKTTSIVLLEADSSIKVTFEKTDGSSEDDKPQDDVISSKNQKTIRGVEATTIKLTTTRGKGYIRLSWKKSAGYKVDYYEVHRSLKKNSGYGTKPFYKTSSGSKTTYKNTKSLKSGTRYYFKVRGVRIIDGKKYYTQYSNKSWRTAYK